MNFSDLVSPVALRQRPIILTSALLATLLIILLLVTCSASDGTKGVDAPQSDTGAQGAAGDISPSGADGVDGETIGLPSHEGPKGTPRVTGPVGETGEQGIAGLDRWCGRSRYRP